MSHNIHESESAIVLEPSRDPIGSVIWLHGLGADGHDFVPIVPELRLPESVPLRFVFPHADFRPVTINNGFVMRAWYDIKELGNPASLRVSAPFEDETGIRESARTIAGYIEREAERGVRSDRIVVAGFSQGGAIALHTALRYDEPLAGIFALSTYLPLQATLAAEAAQSNRRIPILMCHGTQDGIVPVQLGEWSREVLRQAGYAVDWKTYPIEHSVSLEEISDVSRWLRLRFT